MYCGWFYFDDMLVMLMFYFNVYVDMGVIDWLLFKLVFDSYLGVFVDVGFGNCIMFGIDQMFWFDVIGLVVDCIWFVVFLSLVQKCDIFYNNVVCFYCLG